MFVGKLYFYNIAWQCKWLLFFSIEKSRLLKMKKKNDGGQQ
jgi:hypothetical protein